MGIAKIKKHLDDLPPEPRGNYIRMSKTGACTRQLAYGYLGYRGNPLNWRAKLVFELGHMIEGQLVKYAVDGGWFEAGEPITVDIGGVQYQQYKQFEVKAILGGKEIVGHLDGYSLDHPKYPKLPTDFKSMAELTFKHTKESSVSYEYLCQAHCYMEAVGIPAFKFICYNKNTSALHEDIIYYDKKIIKDINNKLETVFKSSVDKLPDRDYKPKGNYLPWQCSYCEFNTICYPDAILEFTTDGKPKLKV